MVLGLVGASWSSGAIHGGGADDGTARAEAERRAGHPGRVVRVGAQACARAACGGGCALLCAWLCCAWESREEEKKEERRRKKKKRKRKERKGKKKKN